MEEQNEHIHTISKMKFQISMAPHPKLVCNCKTRKLKIIIRTFNYKNDNQ